MSEISSKLFPGSDQKQRFSNLFSRVLAADGNDLENVQNVGSHSLRKGGISWLLSMVDGPGKFKCSEQSCDCHCKPFVTDKGIQDSQ
eukprot:166166-Hanusia_phi.AAC.1